MDIEQRRRAIRDLESDLLLPVIARHAPARPAIVELGCGPGFECRWLAGLGPVIGIDPFARPQPMNGALFARAFAERLPIATGAVDVVFSTSVLEHIDGLPAAFAEMKRILRPGGVMVHVVPTAAWKVLAVLSHYGVLARAAVRRITGQRRRQAPSQVASSTEWREVAPTPAARPSLWQRLLPPVHGTSPNNRDELSRFLPSSWQQQFHDVGLVTREVVPLAVYSPPEFLLVPPTRTARVNLASTVAYVVGAG